MALIIFFVVTFVLPLALMNRSIYCENIMLAWDLLGSALTKGLPGETLSGRAGGAYLEHTPRGRFWVPIIDCIMRRKGHCVGAVKGDQMRAQAVLTDDARLPKS